MYFVIYCDESVTKGKFFSHFYGGALVRSNHLEMVIADLNAKKRELNLNDEVKWQKVTSQYLDKYRSLIDLFFDFIERDMVKVRVMFTQNYYRPTALTAEQHENGFFILYYHFLKYAFGLPYSDEASSPVGLKFYLDQLPDTRAKSERFKSYILGLAAHTEFRRAGLFINKEDIAEVVSHDHVILQCLDVILGSMNFRLNDLHKEKPPGSRKRGKRTIAKEQLYKHINVRIQRIYPHFNIGISTGTHGDLSNRWRHPYRHWRLVPTDHEIDPAQGKQKKRNPIHPT